RRPASASTRRPTSAAASSSHPARSRPSDSVRDSDEVEPPRRRGLAGLAALSPPEERLDLLRLELEHRADERPHHVPEIALSGDLEVQMFAAANPLGALDGAHEDPVLRLGRRERAKVVFARQQGGGACEALLVERARDPPAPPRLEG